ncbi:unnamed protein product [Dovyalis caffra]|uniref:Uncharacterized protein n=1 Tax=Dovyalis caffra TaxID=77055 RepID=A0AAV1QQG6_9ROSI|nr:unnamed protein product [Dovyalis caffra]
MSAWWRIQGAEWLQISFRDFCESKSRNVEETAMHGRVKESSTCVAVVLSANTKYLWSASQKADAIPVERVLHTPPAHVSRVSELAQSKPNLENCFRDGNLITVQT